LAAAPNLFLLLMDCRLAQTVIADGAHPLNLNAMSSFFA
jgi:hypothetical protein